MIKLVAFDLDGTIGDTIPMCIKAFKAAVKPYASHELSEDEIIRTFGLNEEGMIRQVAGENWQLALADFYVYYKQMHALCPSPFDGIAEIIKELRQNALLVALITGKGEKSCAITLEEFGMCNCFDRIETGSPQYNRKSDALEKLLAEYRLKASEVVYIGDTVSDVLACKKIGVECLSAAWAKNAPAPALEEINPGNVVLSIAELKRRLPM